MKNSNFCQNTQTIVGKRMKRKFCHASDRCIVLTLKKIIIFTHMDSNKDLLYFTWRMIVESFTYKYLCEGKFHIMFKYPRSTYIWCLCNEIVTINTKVFTNSSIIVSDISKYNLTLDHTTLLFSFQKLVTNVVKTNTQVLTKLNYSQRYSWIILKGQW